MRYRVIYILLLLLPLSGCNRPKDIPLNDLEGIIYDLYVSNAYVDARFTTLPADSLDVYSPVFEKHGYTVTDMRYTIDNFSKRKSAKFSDVIERVADSLRKEAALYTAQLALIDTIDSRIARMYSEVVLGPDSSLVLTKPSDADMHDISIPVRRGMYEIEYSYMLDTMQTSGRAVNVQYRNYLVNSKDLKSNYSYRSYRRGERGREKIEVQVTDTIQRKLKIAFAFGNNNARNNRSAASQKIRLEIDSLKITFFLPKEEGREVLMKDMVHFPIEDSIKAWHDEQIFEKIVIPLRPDTTGLDPRRDTLVR